MTFLLLGVTGFVGWVTYDTMQRISFDTCDLIDGQIVDGTLHARLIPANIAVQVYQFPFVPGAPCWLTPTNVVTFSNGVSTLIVVTAVSAAASIVSFAVPVFACVLSANKHRKDENEDEVFV